MTTIGDDATASDVDRLAEEITAALAAERGEIALEKWIATLRSEALERLVRAVGVGANEAERAIDGLVVTGEYGEAAALESLVIMLRMVERSGRTAEFREEFLAGQ